MKKIQLKRNTSKLHIFMFQNILHLFLPNNNVFSCGQGVDLPSPFMDMSANKKKKLRLLPYEGEPLKSCILKVDSLIQPVS